MLLGVIWLATFLGAACLFLAVLPKPAIELPKILGTRMPRTTFPDFLIPGAARHPLSPLLLPLGRLLARFERRGDGQRTRLVYAGAALNVEEFEGLKALSAVGALLLACVILAEAGKLNTLWLCLAGVGGFLAPELWVRARIVRRNRAVLRLLPEVIDLLSLCVGAGLDFLGALNKVVLANRAFRNEPLIQELSVVLQEIRLGKRRVEALKEMARRVKLTEVSSFARSLAQADRMGTPMSQVLAVHSEDVRAQRFIRAERAALKAPLKILVPLIFCIMPCVAIIIASPVFLQFMRQDVFGKLGMK